MEQGYTYSDPHLTAINSSIMSILVFWLGNAAMYIVYCTEPAFMEPYRVADSWPWKGSAEVRSCMPLFCGQIATNGSVPEEGCL